MSAARQRFAKIVADVHRRLYAELAAHPDQYACRTCGRRGSRLELVPTAGGLWLHPHTSAADCAADQAIEVIVGLVTGREAVA